MSYEVTEDEFAEMVERAIERVPEQFMGQIENLMFAIEQTPPRGEGNLLGRYMGLPLTERGYYAGLVPDVISIYQQPLQRTVSTREELEEQVYVTVVHEIGHYFGLEDDRLEELNWG